MQDAEAYKQKLITEAQGEAQRFLSIFEQYKNAKQVTREGKYTRLEYASFADDRAPRKREGRLDVAVN